MEDRAYERGRIEVVDIKPHRAGLNGDHAIGATTLALIVNEAVYNRIGGQVIINSALYTYSAYDDDADTITLTGSGLTAAAEDDDWVSVYDPIYDTIKTTKSGHVRLLGALDNDVPIHAVFSQQLLDKLGGGIRGTIGEECLLELDGETWRIIDIHGLDDPDASGSLYKIDPFVVAAPGAQTLQLTHVPKPESVHLYWEGDEQEGAFTVVDQTVLIDSTEGADLEVGDELVAKYAYLKGILAPSIAGVPYATEVLADSPMAWYRMGESGAYGSGGSGSDLFSGATGISLDSISGATANSGFNLETGEPFPTGVFANKSAWWSFTSPVDQDVRIDTQLSSTGSNVDTEMAVYTGSAVNALTKIASDGDSGGNLTSLLTFAATAGVGYSLQVCAYNNLDMSYIVRLTGNRMADSSGANRHGNYTGGIYYPTKGVTGLLSDDSNLAAQFVASQACRGLVPYDTWMVQTAFSVEAIIESTQSDGGIASRGYSGSQSWLLNLTGGKLRFTRFGSGGNSQATSVASFNDGQRHHVLATYDATNGTILYVDGVQVATAAPATTPVTTTEPLTVASDGTPPGGGTPYEGILDEVAFYGSALSADRVLAHYNAMVGG